ncbi:MAG: hypothetical protein IPM54_00920 [Polyangiaceae bacterium]|nr:hypothetical protein [Polyangiaceae bacterium]
MRRLACWGFVGVAVVLVASCGARVEIRDSVGSGGAGGAGSGVGAGSTGSSGGITSSSGGMTSSSSSSGMTSSSSSGMTSSSSSGGMTSSSSSSSSGGVICPGFGDECTECLSLQCADIYCACYNNPHCFQLNGCVNGCNGDEVCEQQCYSMYPTGASDLYALSSCGGHNCPVECPGTQPLEPCSECMVETCGDELDACLAFAPCLGLYNCLGGCGSLDLVCQQQCYSSFGDGAQTLQVLLGCTEKQCPDC